jgi:hypothetical protein
MARSAVDLEAVAEDVQRAGGRALAIAGDMFKMAIDIYMVKISYQQKPYRRSVMQTYGATVTPSPSDRTAAVTLTRGSAISAHTASAIRSSHAQGPSPSAPFGTPITLGKQRARPEQPRRL